MFKKYASTGARTKVPRLDILAAGTEFIASTGRIDRGPDLLGTFSLPKFPERLLEWLTKLHYKCLQLHGKCMASALLLDVSTRTWSSCIPHQRCGADAPLLRMKPEDFECHRTSTCLAGSFQTLRETDPRNFSDVVPTFAGLHFLQILAGEANGVWGFVRSRDACCIVKREAVVGNDLEATIRASLTRLTLL